MTQIDRIVFVWNADFSVAGGAKALKELLKGEHTCTLCEIAYHKVTQTSDWKQYKAQLKSKFGAEIKEPCKNQLAPKEVQIAHKDFPTVLVRQGAEVKKVLSSIEIDACAGDFKKFQQKLDQALNKLK